MRLQNLATTCGKVQRRVGPTLRPRSSGGSLLTLPGMAAAASTSAAADAAARLALLPRPHHRRLPPPSSSPAAFSTLSEAGQPTSAISTRNSKALIDSTNILHSSGNGEQGGGAGVEVFWDDGHNSYYDQTWLRVNCPSFLHESGQRTVFPGDVDPELKVVEVRELCFLFFTRMHLSSKIWILLKFSIF